MAVFRNKHNLTVVASVVFVGWAFAACSLDRPGVPFMSDGEGDVDASPDAPPSTGLPDTAPSGDAPPACSEWGFMPSHFDPCLIPAPAGIIDLQEQGTYTYNTDDNTLTGPNLGVTPPSIVLDTTPPARLISIEFLAIGPNSALRVVGNQPLVIASWSDVGVVGRVDVSSGLGSGSGAGANPTECGAGAGGDGGPTTRGAGGGGGGGFGATGGTGGVGSSTGEGTGGAAGMPLGEPLMTVRGGCPGGAGGDGDAANGGGAGGDGGGAVHVTARLTIEISGVVHAGGSGGADPNATDSGGGGGGSGGYIGLEATDVLLPSSAVLAANGGGGAGGANNVAAEPEPGSDGLPARMAAPGGGGHAGANTEGGDGGFRDTAEGQPGGTNDEGAGGAGGGVGVIRVRGALTEDSSEISPALQMF